MIRKLGSKLPEIHQTSFLAETATVIGDVNIGEGTSIWYNAVIRGDIENITIGRFSNIQDNSMVHTDSGMPTKIGDYSVIGHNAVIHGCTIGNNCLIGMGAIILSGAVIGDNSIIGAGSIVTEGKIILNNSLVIGIPGKFKREVTDEEIKNITNNAIRYNQLSQEYKD